MGSIDERQRALSFIAERRKGRDIDRRDLLSRFLQLEKENPTKFDALDVQILATLNVFAGSDTTSIALRAILYYLMITPRVWAKLRKEIDTAVEHGTSSQPAIFTEAQKLPYLEACIKEAMRLHPSLGTQHTRLVPPEGITIDGRYLPKDVSNRPSILYGPKITSADDCRYKLLGNASTEISLRRRCRSLQTREMAPG